jgi:pimeloyl-ACP methyl ester carboxylesterase
VSLQIHQHNRGANPAIFDRSGALAGPTWRDLVGEGLAVLRERSRRGRRVVALGPLPSGDGHPVIVLPPFLCSDLVSRGFREWLAGLGYAVDGWGAGLNVGPTGGAVAAAERVLLHRTEASKASLVGMSLGGVLARALANAHPDRVRRVITVCSPFRLPTTSPLEPLYRALAPLHSGQRVLLKQLTAPPPVPTTAIYSPCDGVVAWRSCVDAPGPHRENIAIANAHTTMLANPKALRIIAERLALP